MHTVLVDDPAAEVWRVVSDSSKAVEWSVYFHHISPVSGADGELGAVRRCYRSTDEGGISWDERVLEIVPERTRRMRVFNLRGMALAVLDQSEFEVWQVLEPVSPTQTKLTFRTSLWEGRPIGEGFSFTLGRVAVERVFRLNLENMKALIEQGPSYQRLHAWEPLRPDEERAVARLNQQG